MVCSSMWTSLVVWVLVSYDHVHILYHSLAACKVYYFSVYAEGFTNDTSKGAYIILSPGPISLQLPPASWGETSSATRDLYMRHLWSFCVSKLHPTNCESLLYNRLSLFISSEWWSVEERINVPISSTPSPDVSGTTNQEMQKSRTLVPAKTKPVFAPKLPLSILYMLLGVSLVVTFHTQIEDVWSRALNRKSMKLLHHILHEIPKRDETPGAWRILTMVRWIGKTTRRVLGRCSRLTGYVAVSGMMRVRAP